jgi:hypothetical protein
MSMVKRPGGHGTEADLGPGSLTSDDIFVLAGYGGRRTWTVTLRATRVDPQCARPDLTPPFWGWRDQGDAVTLELGARML